MAVLLGWIDSAEVALASDECAGEGGTSFNPQKCAASSLFLCFWPIFRLLNQKSLACSDNSRSLTSSHRQLFADASCSPISSWFSMKSVFRAPPQVTPNPLEASQPVLECPFGFSLIDGNCIKGEGSNRRALAR